MKIIGLYACGLSQRDIAKPIKVLYDAELAGNMVIGDKGYDSDEILLCIEDQDAMHTIPPRSNRNDQRSYDKQRYKERHRVENFFGEIKHFRRVATRNNKLASSFFAFALLASISVLLK